MRALDLTPPAVITADESMTLADADLTEITRAMNEHGVRRVLVTRGLELVGIVSMDSVILATAELLNNLSATLGRQLEYEREHLVTPGSGQRPARVATAEG